MLCNRLGLPGEDPAGWRVPVPEQEPTALPAQSPECFRATVPVTALSPTPAAQSPAACCPDEGVRRICFMHLLTMLTEYAESFVRHIEAERSRGRHPSPSQGPTPGGNTASLLWPLVFCSNTLTHHRAFLGITIDPLLGSHYRTWEINSLKQ